MRVSNLSRSNCVDLQSYHVFYLPILFAEFFECYTLNSTGGIPGRSRFERDPECGKRRGNCFGWSRSLRDDIEQELNARYVSH